MSEPSSHARPPVDDPALEGAVELVHHEDIDILILTGSAGTGKTTLVGKLASRLNTGDMRIQLLATTGRAAKILSEKTGKTAATIHSAIYAFHALKGGKNFDDNKELTMNEAGQLYLQFGLRMSGVVESKPDLYIVDEASMLTHERNKRDHTAQFGSGSLLDDLVSFARDKKLLFVGDPCQLPPIADSSISTALQPEFLAERYQKRVAIIELTKVHRQREGNEILHLATWLRDRILNKMVYTGLKILAPEGNQVHLVAGLDQQLERYFKTIGHGKDYTKATFIVPSNKLVGSINARVRAGLGYRDSPKPGELLSVIQNSYTTPLMNGDLVVIEAIEPYESRAGFSFSKVTVRTLLTDDTYQTLMIDELLYNTSPSLTREEAGKLLIDYDQRMRARGFKRHSKPYVDGLRTDAYLNALRCKFGYCLTNHKAQGGEWDEVFVHLNYNLGKFMQPDSEARWWYTAITRARENLYINDGIWIESGAPRVRIVKPPIVRRY
jgi:hypothetical protein